MKRYQVIKIRKRDGLHVGCSFHLSAELPVIFEAGFMPSEILPPVNRGERARDGVGDLPGFRLDCKDSPFYYDVYPMN
jgi:hypothetical protein